MTIKQLSEQRFRPKVIGRVGMGITVPVLDDKGQQVVRDGKPVTTPKATPYFVVPDEVKVATREDQPRQLRIHFDMERFEDVIPHHCMLFMGSGDVVCMGDGEKVLYRCHVGEKYQMTPVVYGGVARWSVIEEMGLLELWKDGNGYGTVERIGTNALRCLYMECPRYGPGRCRPTGRLRFGIEGITKHGCYQLTFHWNPMRDLIDQLKSGAQWIKLRLGRPTIAYPAKWLLNLMGPEEMWMKVRVRGKVENRLIKNVYTPELELDPSWMEEVEAGRVVLPAVERITEEDIWGPEEEQMDKSLLETKSWRSGQGKRTMKI